MANHFQSAHFASTHFLSTHFSGGTAQVIEILDPGLDLSELIRLPNGAIIAIAIATLIILEEDLDV